MRFDLAKTHGWLVEELAAEHGIAESMNSIIDACSRAHPHPDWEEFRQLPYEDLTPLNKWIEMPFRFDPPLEPVRGLWFGLFNPIRGTTPTADVYVSGSKCFDADDACCEWACDTVWWPENRYAESALLDAIYKIAYRPGGLKNDAEYPLCLGYGAFAIRSLLNRIASKLILESVGPVGVAVGFDSGDCLRLGRFTEQGLISI